MLVGYARVSTLDQKERLEFQLRALEKAGCEKLFVEQVFSVNNAVREILAEVFASLQEGDTLIVTRLDRLARSVAHLMQILEELSVIGAGLRIIDMDIDTNTLTGQLKVFTLRGVAEFERELMLERQREGIAKAKAAGKYLGRKPTARAHAKEVLELHGKGVGPTEIAQRVKIGRASVYRILQSDQGKEKA